MKTTDINSLACSAAQTAMPRAQFLSSILPEDRSHAAMQYDRAIRLANCDDPTDDAVTAESERIARVTRICEHLKSHDHTATLARWAQGRILSEGMARDLRNAEEAAASLTDTEIHAARPLAIANLNTDRNYLRARLGVKN